MALCIASSSFLSFSNQALSADALPEVLLPNDEQPGAYFGYSLAVDQNTLAIGAPLDSELGTNAGAVYVYQYAALGGGSWTFVKKIRGDDTVSNDNFGQAIAMHADRIVVGAPLHDANGRMNSGAAYVFARDEGGSNNWGQVQKVLSPMNPANNQFGIALGLHADTLVVGVPSDVQMGGNTGAAHIYEDAGTGFQHVKRLTADDGLFGDSFGSATAIHGDYAAVTAPLDDTPQVNAGSIYIYARNQGGANQWGQMRKITSGDGAVFDQLGISVALSGEMLVAGAPFHANQTQSGAVYVFQKNQGGDGQWGQSQELWLTNAVANSQFGASVAMDGTRMMVGAPHADGIQPTSGAAYLFEIATETTNQWRLVREVAGDAFMSNDRLGASVGVTENSALAGAPLHDENCPPDEDCNAGAVLVLSLTAAPEPPPRLFISLDQEGAILSLEGSPDETWIIQANENLSDGVWNEIGEITTDDAGQGQLSLSDLTSFSERFFRAMEP